MLAAPTAKIVPGSLSTLPKFGGLSRSDDHLPVICRVAFGGDTGSRPVPKRFSCPCDMARWLDAAKSQHFCHVSSSPKCPFHRILGPQQLTRPLSKMSSENLLSWLSRQRRAKIQENASDPLFFELIVQRGHIKARRRGLGRLMKWFERRMCLTHTFSSWRLVARIPSTELILVCENDLSGYRDTCSDLMFCELAISELSSRIVDSLAREAHEAIQKISDAIYEVTTGPQEFCLFSILCTKRVKVVPKWCTKRMGCSQRL